MQHFARARSGSKDRVVAALAGVAEAGALLLGAVHLADEGVEVDHKALAARSRAGRPGSPDRLRQHPIKLAHMPEAERAQEGAERRGRHHAVSKQHLGAPGPQHVAIVDRIGSKRHRVHERADLAARLRGARALAEVDHLVDKPLEAQPVDQGARQHHSSVGKQALVVELDRYRVGPHGHLRMLHHASDLLTQAAAALYSRFLPAQEVIFVSASDGSSPATRWIEVKILRPSLARVEPGAPATKPTAVVLLSEIGEGIPC